MAIFHLDIRPVARSRGRTATAAAAYRAGERIRDERTGALYNHSKRDDVLHKEIFLPARLDRADAGVQWALDRSTLWNTAEKVERQSNSRVAREYQIALPAELSGEQRLALARAFSREIADRYNVAVDLAVHAPRPEGDPRNFHAHLLATTREVTPEGLGPKTGLDMEGGVRSELGFPPSRQEFKALRARWAELTNEALRAAHLEARVDHRSLEAQGIDREPTPRIPTAAIATERRRGHSEIAERIREEYRARVAARQERTALRGAREAPSDEARRSTGARRESIAPQDMDARRRQAVQEWLSIERASGRPGPEPRKRARNRSLWMRFAGRPSPNGGAFGQGGRKVSLPRQASRVALQDASRSGPDSDTTRRASATISPHESEPFPPLSFASCFAYSPEGSGPLCDEGRLLCARLKAVDPVWLPRLAARVWLESLGHGRLGAVFGDRVVLVPVPGSTPARGDGSWVGERLAWCLKEVGLAAQVWPLVRRRHAVRKSAFAPAGGRPTVLEHYASFAVEHTSHGVLPMTLVDDVITRGRTLLAAAARLREAFPGAEIRAFALVRTLARHEPLCRLLDPCVGEVRWISGDARRAP